MSIHRVDITFSDGSPKIIEVRQGPKGPSGESSPEGVLAALDAMDAGQQAQARGHIGAVASDDSRLSDSRTPTAHASSHATLGSDPLAPADIGAATETDLQTVAGVAAGAVASISGIEETLDHANGYPALNLSANYVLLTSGLGKTIVLNGHQLTLPAAGWTEGDSIAITGSGTVVNGLNPAVTFDGSMTVVMRWYSAAGWVVFSVSAGTGEHAITHGINGSDRVTPNSIGAFSYDTTAQVVVPMDGNDEDRGVALLEAYVAAKLLSPNGTTRSAQNRAAVILPPGNYKMANTLVLDAEHVDIIALVPQLGGLPSNADDWPVGVQPAPLSLFRPPCTNVYFDGPSVTVVEQTARDVRLVGFSIAQTYQDPSYFGSPSGDPCCAFAFTSTDDNANDLSVYELMYFWHSTPFHNGDGVLANSYFPTGFAKHVAGRWNNCIFGFAGLRVGLNGNFTAIVTDCYAGPYSIGGDSPGGSMGPCLLQRVKCVGLLNGLFPGIGCFGGCSEWGIPSTSDALFIDCEAGLGSYNIGATAAGTYIRCVGGGASFGSDNDLIHTGEFSGYAEGCVGGAGSFGGSVYSSTKGKLTGTLVNCTISQTAPTDYAWRLESAKIERCSLAVGRTNTNCITLLDSGNSIVDSKILVVQGGSGVPIYASSPVSAAIYKCQMNNASVTPNGIHPNVTNTVKAPFNVMVDSTQSVLAQLGAAPATQTKTGNFTAEVGGRYITESAGNISITDPTGTVQGQSYEVWIGSGTIQFNGTGTSYAASRFSIRRRFNGSAWATPAPMITDTLQVGSNTWTGSTISGAQAFSSTTRPTSSGTGTPAATSLMTRDDVDYRSGYSIKSTTARTRTTQNAYSDDEDLVASLEANSAYYFRIRVNATHASSSSLGVQLKYTGTINGTGYNIGAQYSNQSGTSAQIRWQTVTAGSITEAQSSTNHSCSIEGILLTGTAGTFSLQIANAAATGTVTRTAGIMKLEKL